MRYRTSLVLILLVLIMPESVLAEMRVFYISAQFPERGYIELTNSASRAEFCKDSLQGLDLAQSALGLVDCNGHKNQKQISKPIEVLLLIDDRALTSRTVKLLGGVPKIIENRAFIPPTYGRYFSPKHNRYYWVYLVGESIYERDEIGFSPSPDAWQGRIEAALSESDINVGVPIIVKKSPEYAKAVLSARPGQVRQTDTSPISTNSNDVHSGSTSSEHNNNMSSHHTSGPIRGHSSSRTSTSNHRHSPTENDTNSANSSNDLIGGECQLGRAILMNVGVSDFKYVSGQIVAEFNYNVSRSQAVQCIWGGRVNPSIYVLYPDPEAPDFGSGKYTRFVINLNNVPQRYQEYLNAMNPNIRRSYIGFANRIAAQNGFDHTELPHITDSARVELKRDMAALGVGDTSAKVYPGIAPYTRVLVWMRRSPNYMGGTDINLEIWPYMPENKSAYAQMGMSKSRAGIYADLAKNLNRWMKRYVEMREKPWSISEGLNQWREMGERQYKMLLLNLVPPWGRIFLYVLNNSIQVN